MESIIREILDRLRTGEDLDGAAFESLIRRHNRNLAPGARPFAKKRLMPYYLKVKETDPARWERWNIDPETEKKLLSLMQIKPRRTASGVATITVITKPWKCTSDCVYCPNDLTMPKSYLGDEPACQRAERNWFDPYLQVSSRLRALTHMGHVTDKIELIVLGGTWSDYPQAYQIWFMTELFRALNDGGSPDEAERRRRLYREAGLSNDKDELRERVRHQQNAIAAGALTYNQAWRELYEHDPAWQKLAAWQEATFADLESEHRRNENAAHRVVGLVVETRPDAISIANLTLLRQLGCTKVQMGIQSLDERVLALNHRRINAATIEEAFSLLRLFGFKIHAHFMVNLYGSTPAADKLDYRRFVTENACQPDEVKLYPCALVAGTGLCARHDDGSWRPYTEEELVDVLVADTLATPPFVRISRMIRDFSAHDIVAGNKKVNLRQLVERTIEKNGESVSEIRYREISTQPAHIDELSLETVSYDTSATSEHFLQWTMPDGKIAGFLRLSLPQTDAVERRPGLPVMSDEAMIREVHVYGQVAGLHATGAGAQHWGLGRKLVERACEIARTHGYARINVISSVGTREYYRKLGFVDNGLYQRKDLD